MARIGILLIAAICYVIFFAAFLYLVGFVAAIDQLPTNVDKGMQAAPFVAAIIDIALIGLFGLQHSVMARQGFKQGWTRIVHPALERSFYVLATVIALALIFAFWHPIPGYLWRVENETARIAIWALFALGWTVLFIATWLINHFELFGLAQAWRNLRGVDAPGHVMRTPLFYKMVRHPIYTGIFLAVWATPDMSWSHLLLAVGFTVYILIGIHYEEKDLVSWHGEEYIVYRRTVGAIIPGIGKKA